MPNLAFVLAPVAPIPDILPEEPTRISPHDEAVFEWEDGPYPEEADYPDPVSEQPRRDASLRRLLRYRDATFKAVKSRRGTAAWLAHSAKANAFDLGRHSGDDLGRLYDIAFAYGGDHAALWTVGRVVHLWAARAGAPGERPRVLELAIRIDAPRDTGRSPDVAERIIRWFEGSPIAPDADRLRRAMSTATLSVPDWFAAFGVPGAREVEAPDAVATWAAFESAADALLGGGAPDPAARKLVNSLIDDRDAQLPARPASKRGVTARRVADAFRAMLDALGTPPSARLAACADAATLYDRITSGPAGDRLLHTKSTPLAVSLALGRLLAHYPVHVRRDPVFLALASLDAEVWNGHAFVDPLAELAEGAPAGFTVAIVPAAHEEAFREAHGTRSYESAARDEWAGEVAIDIRRASREEHVRAFERWFAKARADGAIMRAEGDGTTSVRRFTGGVPADATTPGDDATTRAARALDLRGAILAAGFPDILEPGELAEAHRIAETDAPPVAARSALAAVLEAGDPVRVPSLIDHAWPRHEEPFAMLLRLPTTDEEYMAALARDLRASREGSEVWIPTSTVDAWQLVRVLGDLPAGSRLAVAIGKAIEHVAVAPELARTLPVPPQGTRAPGWVPPVIVRTTSEDVYVTADLTRLRWAREDGLEAGKTLARRYPSLVKAGTSVSIADLLALYDEQLDAVGFRLLGDLLATHLGGLAIRAYVHADGTAVAVVAVIPGRRLVECEIQSLLTDGTEVTTSSLDLGQPAKPGSSLRRLQVGIEKLWHAHAQHLAEVRGDRALRPPPATLAEFTHLLDP